MNESHTQDLEKTEYMEPMTDEAVEVYANTVAEEMDEEKVITSAGMEFITSPTNIPNEEDQERIMSRIEEIQNGKETSTEQNEADAGAGEGKQASEGSESASDEEATQEAVAQDDAPVDAVAETEDTDASEVGEPA